MKKFRKPYISCILTVLLLFTSCQSGIESIEDANETSSISLKNSDSNNSLLVNFVSVHINTIENYLLDPEYFKDYPTNLVSELEDYVNYDDLAVYLAENGIETPFEFANMYFHVQKNINTFLENYDSSNMTQQEIENMILDEIANQLGTDAKTYHNCGYIYNRAVSRCHRNFYASLAVAGISAFWTLGTGTVVGIGAAGAIAINCVLEAKADLRECLDIHRQ